MKAIQKKVVELQAEEHGLHERRNELNTLAKKVRVCTQGPVLSTDSPLSVLCEREANLCGSGYVGMCRNRRSVLGLSVFVKAITRWVVTFVY